MLLYARLDIFFATNIHIPSCFLFYKFSQPNFNLIKVLSVFFKFNYQINITFNGLFTPGIGAEKPDSDNMKPLPEHFFVPGKKKQQLISCFHWNTKVHKIVNTIIAN